MKKTMKRWFERLVERDNLFIEQKGDNGYPGKVAKQINEALVEGSFVLGKAR